MAILRMARASIFSKLKAAARAEAAAHQKCPYAASTIDETLSKDGMLLFRGHICYSPCDSISLARIGPQAHEHRDAYGMRAVNRLQTCRDAIGRDLRADGRGQMRDQIEIAIVAERVGLHCPMGFS